MAGTSCQRRDPPHPSLLPPGEKGQESRRCPMATDTNTLNLNSYRPLGSGSGAGTTMLGSFAKPQGPWVPARGPERRCWGPSPRPRAAWVPARGVERRCWVHSPSPRAPWVPARGPGRRCWGRSPRPRALVSGSGFRLGGRNDDAGVLRQALGPPGFRNGGWSDDAGLRCQAPGPPGFRLGGWNDDAGLWCWGYGRSTVTSWPCWE